jgi:SAM-dependent methyltransferase
MTAPAWAPHGAALRDYQNGLVGAEVTVRGEDGAEERVPAAVFFRGPAEFSALEEAALACCRGRVLDAGAGAGSHSLDLQARGLPVVALDVSPEAVAVMRERGVRDVRCGDIFTLRGERFDTLLMMMNGVGIAGSLAGLDRLLGTIHRLLAPDGQFLLDSYDPRDPDVPADPGSESKAQYVGEMRFQLEYAGVCGPFYEWLFVDLPTLTDRAARAGFCCEGLWHEEEGHYFARLTSVGGRPRDGLVQRTKSPRQEATHGPNR